MDGISKRVTKTAVQMINNSITKLIDASKVSPISWWRDSIRLTPLRVKSMKP